MLELLKNNQKLNKIYINLILFNKGGFPPFFDTESEFISID